MKFRRGGWLSHPRACDSNIKELFGFDREDSFYVNRPLERRDFVLFGLIRDCLVLGASSEFSVLGRIRAGARTDSSGFAPSP